MFRFNDLCYFCRQPLRMVRQSLCSCCLKKVMAQTTSCPLCGLPSKQATTPCRRCLLQRPPWQRLIAVNDYCSPLKEIIIEFKYYQRFQFVPLLGRLFVLRWFFLRQQFALAKPDLLLAVPLYHWRHWQRGFNQSDLLARYLAKYLACPYSRHVLQRTHATKPQQSLPGKQRRSNLVGAFSVTGKVNGLHIAIIDDVMTTGSTFKILTQLLLAQGAKQVDIWCICRHLLNN